MRLNWRRRCRRWWQAPWRGLVSDVIVLDHASQDGSSRVADAAGARFCTSWDMTDIVRSARGDWLLLLEAGARPAGRWIDDVAEYMSLNKMPARFSPSRQYRRPFLQRIVNTARAAGAGITAVEAAGGSRSPNPPCSLAISPMAGRCASLEANSCRHGWPSPIARVRKACSSGSPQKEQVLSRPALSSLKSMLLMSREAGCPGRYG
jgi:hypothetical protein